MFQAPQILHCQASLRGGSYMVSWLRSCKISFKNLKSMHVEMSWWILKPLRNWWQLFDVHCTTVFNNCCQEAATNRKIKILDRISSTNPCKVSNSSLTDTFIKLIFTLTVSLFVSLNLHRDMSWQQETPLRIVRLVTIWSEGWGDMLSLNLCQSFVEFIPDWSCLWLAWNLSIIDLPNRVFDWKLKLG